MKYANPDKRCTYPASDIDYCWTYAQSVDAGVKCDCAGCAYWKRTKADSVSVGALTLSRHGDKIWIGVDGGEGAEFDEKAVETALLEFYDNNF